MNEIPPCFCFRSVHIHTIFSHLSGHEKSQQKYLYLTSIHSQGKIGIIGSWFLPFTWGVAVSGTMKCQQQLPHFKWIECGIMHFIIFVPLQLVLWFLADMGKDELKHLGALLLQVEFQAGKLALGLLLQLCGFRFATIFSIFVNF